MVRTNLPLDKQVFEEFADEVERRKMNLFAFANVSMTAVTKASREGGDPEELLRTWKMTKILRQSDAVTLPSDLVEELVRRIYRQDSAFLHRRFRELGSSLVGLLKIEAEGIDELASLAKDLALIIPIKHFSVTPLKGDTLQVDVVGAGKGYETTECAAEFLKAIIAGYGYLITAEELRAGTIRLLLQKAPD